MIEVEEETTTNHAVKAVTMLVLCLSAAFVYDLPITDVELTFFFLSPLQQRSRDGESSYGATTLWILGSSTPLVRWNLSAPMTVVLAMTQLQASNSQANFVVLLVQCKKTAKDCLLEK
jgi:hypothetical protein